MLHDGAVNKRKALAACAAAVGAIGLAAATGLAAFAGPARAAGRRAPRARCTP